MRCLWHKHERERRMLLNKNFELNSPNKCWGWGDGGGGQIGKNRSAGEFLVIWCIEPWNFKILPILQFAMPNYWTRTLPPFHKRVMIHSWPCIVHRTLVGMHPVLCEYTMRWVCLPIREFQKDAEAGQVIGQHWPFQITASLVLSLSCGGNKNSEQTVRS